MSDVRLAVLGATGHVGRVLTAGIARAAGFRVTALARSAERLSAFLSAEGLIGEVAAGDIESLAEGSFDAIVDCTGIGDPSRFGPHARELVRVQQHFDGMTLDYVDAHPDCRLVCIGSGAAYLTDFDEPAGLGRPPCIRSDEVRARDAYGVVKAMSETQHRIADDLAVVDLRLFGLFSPHLDLSGHYLLCQAMTALLTGDVLVTDGVDVVRDYSHPADLTALVTGVIGAPPVNGAIDVYSAAPASKWEMLDALARSYGLRYEIRPDSSTVSATGQKPFYYSTDRAAAAYGFKPGYTTLECVLEVAGTILGSRPGDEEGVPHV